MDKIVLRDLEVDAHVGVLPEEQAHPQRLWISVTMELDLAAAGRTDSPTATTDYEMVAGLIRQIVHERPRKLIEAVADEIAQEILQRRLAVTVTVEVKKFSIPRSRYVSVEITRSQ
ncbi:MAG: dihydroneopterin aldolase [Verrucomicrobiae bacterium]|nr:dihydroneopterin aldolase [Verrucomicrobiae bacterium]MCX7914678.1 dihydroneopterin aldolase [Verrucomicrobiae bacterium]MDW8343393.1 dihydroneopterin aldolase [Verrucomicrobiae bacterium]